MPPPWDLASSRRPFFGQQSKLRVTRGQKSLMPPSQVSLTMNESGNDFCRQKVCADRYLWLVLLQKPDEAPGVESIQCKSPSFVLPRLVEMIIEPAESVRRTVDQFEVSSGVEVVKDLVGVVQRIHMSTLSSGTHLDDRLFDSLCRADMTGSGRRG
jgi:hypothetical protein